MATLYVLQGRDQGKSFDLLGPTQSLGRDACSNLETMYRTVQAVSHTLDINQLVVRIIDLIFGWVEADRGCIMLIDHETGELMPAASRTRQAISPGERMVISRSILDFVMD